MEEYLKDEGVAGAAIVSPSNIIKEAYKICGFVNEDIWLGMLKDRNDTEHIYDKEAADRLVERILNTYIKEFQEMEAYFDERYKDSRCF